MQAPSPARSRHRAPLYDDILRERYDRVEPRLADLDQLQTIAGGYPSRARVPVRARARAAAGTQDLAAGSTSRGRRARSSAPRTAPRAEWDAVFVDLGRRRLVPVLALTRATTSRRGRAATHVRRDDARHGTISS